MTKITLPPCEFWPGATACCAAEFVEGGEMGLCKYLREQAKCEYYKPEGGFDAVAAAVREAFDGIVIIGLNNVSDKRDIILCQIGRILSLDSYNENPAPDKIFTIAQETGPNDTAALVAAVNKANS